MPYFVLHHSAGDFLFRRSPDGAFARLVGSTWSPVDVDPETFATDPTVEELVAPPAGRIGAWRVDGPEPVPYPFSQPTPGRSVRE